MYGKVFARFRNVHSARASLSGLLIVLTALSIGCAGKKPVTAVAPTALQAVDVVWGSFTVAPGKFTPYKFSVTPGMAHPTLQGSFNASGGSGNDIEVYLLEDNQFQNWQNGNHSNAIYTSGRVTADKVNVTLPTDPGTYYLVFSNKFSYITNKAVTADLKLLSSSQSAQSAKPTASAR